MTGASTPTRSATRCVSVRNSIRVRKSRSGPASGARTSSAVSGSGRTTSRFKVTSSRERRIWSAFSISVWRRFGCLISPARASRVSRSPYSVMSWAAVLMPMPGAPGTLSIESPASAWTSITRSGPTPNFSATSSGPMRRFFSVSTISTPPPTSCIRSLSAEMMVTRPPAALAISA
jgi:hypothetical protein